MLFAKYSSKIWFKSKAVKPYAKRFYEVYKIKHIIYINSKLYV